MLEARVCKKSHVPIKLGMKRKIFSSVWSCDVACLRSVGCLGRPLLWLILASAAIVVPGSVRVARVCWALGWRDAPRVRSASVAVALHESPCRRYVGKYWVVDVVQ